MAFLLISSLRLKEKSILKNENFTNDNHVVVLYKNANEKIEIEALKELSDKEIPISFLANKEDEVGYSVVFQLGKMVAEEKINSILFYDEVDQDLLSALSYCGINTKVINKKRAVVPVSSTSITDGPVVKKRGRKPKIVETSAVNE